MRFSSTSVVLAASLLGSVVAADIDPVIVKGNKFFFKNSGAQFFMKGVAYQEDSSAGDSDAASYLDPLANPTNCKRDIPLLQELGTNTIRVYAIDPKGDHTQCMQMLQDAGIYVVSDLSEPKISINRDAPTWDDKIYARYTAVIDEMQKYPNVLGFFAGNEVSNNATNTNASPFVKAAVRDMKAYIKAKGYRTIPVGYATNDDADIRLSLAHYFNCGTMEDSVDFWGYNIYSWCGDSSFQRSGYDKRTKEFETYNVPVFFAEYGCNEVRPRKFTDVAALYGPLMTPVWSGGIVYMYHEEANKYGLVQVSGGTVTKLPDFNNLKAQIAKIKPSGVQANAFTPTNSALSTCPTIGSDWNAAAQLPPSPNQQLCDCMVESLSCVAKSDIDSKTAASLFSFICGEGGTDCSGISADGAKGKYGAYSMCDTTEQLSWAMNKYYNDQNKAADACDFEGAAQKQTAVKATGACSPLIEQAGTDGTGTVTSAPSASGGSDGDESSAAGVFVSSIHLGAFKIGAALITAAFGGIALVVL